MTGDLAETETSNRGKTRWLVAGCITAVVCAYVTYSNAFGAATDFVFDDGWALMTNDDALSDRGSWWALFHNDFWGKRIDSPESNRSYRPFTIGSYRVEHWLHGHSLPLLRVVNVSLHALNCALIVWYCVKVLGMRAMGGAVSAGILFACHPIHVESVVNIVGRAELLNAFFGLINSLLVLEIFAQLLHDEAKWTWRRYWRVASLTLAYCLCFVCGCLSKDSFISILGVQFVSLALDSRRLFTTSVSVRKVVTLFVLVVTFIGSLGVAYLSFRYWLMDGKIDLKASGLLSRAENPHLFVEDPLQRRLYLWFIQCKNFQLLMRPWPLCAEYSFNCLPVIEGWHDPRIPMMAAGTAAVVAALVYLVRRLIVSSPADPSSMAGPAALAVAWVIIPYLPVCHLLVTVGTMIAERCLYVPSIGQCMLFGLFVDKYVMPHSGRQKVFAAVLIAVFSICVDLCWIRNMEWMTSSSLFESAVRVCPGSAKHHQQLALSRYSEGRFEEGYRLLVRALENDPLYCEAEWHIARYLMNRSRMEDAQKYLRKCSSCAPHAEQCIEAYRGGRKMLHPNMTLAEETEDNAGLTNQPRIGATLYRQAGLAYLQKEHRPCAAFAAFQRSLSAREELKFDGPLGEVEDSACNVLYWTVKTGRDCWLSTRSRGQARAKTWKKILNAANVTQSKCQVPWRELAMKPKSASETEYQLLMKEGLQRPLALKNVGAEVLGALEQVMSSGEGAVDVADMETVLGVLLAPVCHQGRDASMPRPADAALRHGLEMLLEDTELRPRFSGAIVQVAQHLVKLWLTNATSSKAGEAQFRDRMETSLVSRVDACIPELVGYLSCETSVVVAQFAPWSSVRAEHRRRCASAASCPSTVDRCKG